MNSLFYLKIKRIIDLFFAVLLLLPSLPLFILCCILITFSLREYPLFYQLRHGKNCVPFMIVKLKTMRSLRPGQSLQDHQRVTRLTTLIRTLRLDELPQLLCIITNKMSFVGPRPLPVEYTMRGSSRFPLRYKVKPGILGLAQLYGGETLPFYQRLRFDLLYTNHLSFALDCHIICRTIIFFLSRLFSRSSLTPVKSLPEFR